MEQVDYGNIDDQHYHNQLSKNLMFVISKQCNNLVKHWGITTVVFIEILLYCGMAAVE